MEQDSYFDEYSISSLKEILDNEFEALLIAYRVDVLEKYQQIEEFYKQADNNNMLKSIHTLKGTSGNIGAIPFSLLCADLENSIRDDNKAVDDNKTLIVERYQIFLDAKDTLLKNIDGLLKASDNK